MSHRGGLFVALSLFILCAMFFPSLASAAKSQTPPPDGATKPSEVVWSQEKGALTVTLNASAELNSLYGTPLALTVCLYQLADVAKFSALAANFDGVEQLLAGEIDLLGGAALMSRVEYIQPGERITRTFDRMEGAKYFAVVAGYAHRDAAKCSAFEPFPIKETTIKLKRRKRAVYYTAGTLAAGVLLGSEAVTINGGEGGDE